MRLPRPDDAGGYRSVIDAHFQNEMIEALLIDARQSFLKLQSELHEGDEMVPPGTVLRLRRLGYPRGGHVGRAYRLDLDDVLEFLLIKYLTKIRENIETNLNIYRDQSNL